MKKIVFIITVLLSIMKVNAQHATHDHGSWYLTDGFHFLNPTSFNSTTTPLGYPAITSYFATGFGGYGEGRYWIIGGEGAYINSSNSINGKSAEGYGGLGYFYAGYKLLQTSHWKIYPTLGIGMGGVTCVLTDPVTSGSTINDVLISEPNSRTFQQASFIFHSGLVAEYRFHKKFFFAMKSGYNFSGSQKAWQADGLQESLSVKDSFEGLYAQGHFGIYFR